MSAEGPSQVKSILLCSRECALHELHATCAAVPAVRQGQHWSNGGGSRGRRCVSLASGLSAGVAYLISDLPDYGHVCRSTSCYPALRRRHGRQGGDVGVDASHDDMRPPRLLPLLAISCRPIITLETGCRVQSSSNPSSKVERPGLRATMLACTVISRPSASCRPARHTGGRRRPQPRRPSLARAPAVASAEAGKQDKEAREPSDTAGNVLVQFRLQRR